MNNAQKQIIKQWREVNNQYMDNKRYEEKAHLQDNNKARIYEEKKKQNKQKKIIADRYTTIRTLKPIKDCKSCDFHNNYTCFDHEDEQIKEVYPNVHYTDDLEWVVYE